MSKSTNSKQKFSQGGRQLYHFRQRKNKTSCGVGENGFDWTSAIHPPSSEFEQHLQICPFSLPLEGGGEIERIHNSHHFSGVGVKILGE